MAPMTGRANVPESLKTIIVCVDSYEDSFIEGAVFHGSFQGCREFANLMQLILIVENILDETGFPQAAAEKRRFRAACATNNETAGEPRTESEFDGSEHGIEARKGRLATFMLKVMFRHSASWQGSVAWTEGSREESFRSALELFALMDSALIHSVAENGAD